MVVVAILSVTAAILVPRFLKDQIRKRQEECHTSLRSLLSVEKGFFQKNGRYAHDLEELGWEAAGKKIHRYQFLPGRPPESGFLFECAGNVDRDSTLDQATIDETGTLVQISDDYKN